MEIPVGLKGEVCTLVESEDTALSVGSGSLRFMPRLAWLHSWKVLPVRLWKAF